MTQNRRRIARYPEILPYSIGFWRGSKVPRDMQTELRTLGYFSIAMALLFPLREWLSLLWAASSFDSFKFILSFQNTCFTSLVFLIGGLVAYGFCSAVLTLEMGESSDLLRGCVCGVILMVCFMACSFVASEGFFVVPSLWIISNGIIAGGCVYFRHFRDQFAEASPDEDCAKWSIGSEYYRMKHEDLRIFLDRSIQAVFALAGAMVASMGILFADPDMWHGADAHEHRVDCLSALFIFLAFSSQVMGLFFFIVQPLVKELLDVKTHLLDRKWRD